MKKKRSKYFVILLLIVCIINGCKEDPVTETPENNNNQNPESPQLTEPANNSTIISFTPLIKWQAFQGANNYRVQVSMDANFAGTIIADTTLNAAQLTIQPGLLTTNIYYYWRVIANLQSGTSNWSAVWRFRIILGPPSPPNLISPPNNSTNQPFLPLFDWDDPATAESYRIQVSDTASFYRVLLDSSRITVSELQCPAMLLNTNTRYYWRVNATNSNGASTSNWSTVFNFTTLDGPSPNSISGTITFADSNFPPFPSYFLAGVYLTTQQWPPVDFPPYGFDSLTIQQIGNTYQASYEIRNLPSGNYYVTALVVDQVLLSPRYMGIYGCDTVHVPFSNCPLNPTSVSITNNTGVENINFLSWADTSKAIF